EISYYLSKVCIEADPVFRFAVAVTLDDQSGYKPLKSAMSKMASELKARAGSDREDNRIEIMRLVWADLAQGRYEGGKGGPLSDVFKGLDAQSRAVLVASDVSGLSVEEMATVFKQSDAQLRKTLADARRVLCTQKATTNDDANFFFAN